MIEYQSSGKGILYLKHLCLFHDVCTIINFKLTLTHVLKSLAVYPFYHYLLSFAFFGICIYAYVPRDFCCSN